MARFFSQTTNPGIRSFTFKSHELSSSIVRIPGSCRARIVMVVLFQFNIQAIFVQAYVSKFSTQGDGPKCTNFQPYNNEPFVVLSSQDRLCENFTSRAVLTRYRSVLEDRCRSSLFLSFDARRRSWMDSRYEPLTF